MRDEKIISTVEGRFIYTCQTGIEKRRRRSWSPQILIVIAIKPTPDKPLSLQVPKCPWRQLVERTRKTVEASRELQRNATPASIGPTSDQWRVSFDTLEEGSKTRCRSQIQESRAMLGYEVLYLCSGTVLYCTSRSKATSYVDPGPSRAGQFITLWQT